MVCCETLHSKEALDSSVLVRTDGEYLKIPIDHIKDKLQEVCVGDQT